MGGWMTYGRVRDRNGLRKRGEGYGHLAFRVVDDLDRMEADYLDPVYPQPPYATRPADSDPAAECATATGVDVETVRRVLRYVFLEARCLTPPR